MRQRKNIYVALSLLPLTLIALESCSPSKSAAAGDEVSPAAPVHVSPVKRASLSRIISAEAVLYPLKQANIVPKVAAPVARFLVQRGDHVRQGQLVAVLEHRDLAAAAQESKQLYQQAEATYQTAISATIPDDLAKAQTDLESARQTLAGAQKVYDSRQTLLQQGALSRRLVDDSQVTLAQAQAQFETARQHLNSLQSVGLAEQRKGALAQMDAAQSHYAGAAAQLSYADVRSPISGIISDRPVSLGEMAGNGSALLSVVDISHVVARANVSVQQAASIVTGRPATISGAGSSLNGKVTVVSPAVDPNTTTVQIWIEAANPGERLKLGTTVQVAIDAGELPDAIVVPETALLASEDGGEKVMVAGSDSLAHNRAVDVGVRSKSNVQILSGLKVGELVITQGALGLDDKAKIQIDKGEAGH